MTEQERINAEVELERFRNADQIGRIYMKASVYRDADGSDCTNGGETSHFTELYVFSAKLSRNAAVLLIEERKLNQFQCVHMENRKPCGRDYLNARPLALGRRDRWCMMGGNFIYSCDSRFEEVTGSCYPVPVHDRIEE